MAQPLLQAEKINYQSRKTRISGTAKKAKEIRGRPGETRGILDVYLGVTKTGKSTLIGTRDGRTRGKGGFHSHNRKQAITMDTEKFEGTRVWMLDTQGICDSRGVKDDEAIMRGIFKKMGERNLQWIRVIWTTNPEQAATPTLQKIAKFIHNLGSPEEGDSSGEIWKSVAIICKGGDGVQSLEGPLGAIQETTKAGPPNVVSKNLHILDYLGEDSTVKKFARRVTDKERKAELWLHAREVGPWQRELLYNVPAFQLVCKDGRCAKCGYKGDPRGLHPRCHRMGHWGKLILDKSHQGKWIQGCVKRNEKRIDDKAVIKPILSLNTYLESKEWEQKTQDSLLFASETVASTVGWGAVALGVMADHTFVPGTHFWGYWDCCMGKDEKDDDCKNDPVQRYLGCVCLQDRPIEECPLKICQDCGNDFGKALGTNCTGEHEFVENRDVFDDFDFHDMPGHNHSDKQIKDMAMDRRRDVFEALFREKRGIPKLLR